jgi:TPR repeat protein
LYHAGNGVELNDAKAVHYYHLAAQQGNTDAVKKLRHLNIQHK